jgi:hypothetical protein
LCIVLLKVASALQPAVLSSHLLTPCAQAERAKIATKERATVKRFIYFSFIYLNFIPLKTGFSFT